MEYSLTYTADLKSSRTFQDENMEEMKLCNGIPMGTCDHSWIQRDGTDFKVRGPNYLKDKKKIQTAPAYFNIVNVDGFVCSGQDPLPETLNYLCNQRVRGDDARYFIAHFDLGEEHIAFTFAQVAEPIESAKVALDKFFKATDEELNSLLKMIPMAVEGPWIAKKAIGDKNPTPAIIGKKLKCTWSRPDERALVFHCNVNSSGPAAAILSTVKTYTTSMIIDLAFVIEAREVEELPEQILGVARIHRLDLNCFRMA
jgi:hypothetical protein